MLGMTPRYDVEQFHDYYVGDFGSRNWVGDDGEVLPDSKKRSLVWSVTDTAGVPVPSWEPLSRGHFLAIIERLRSRREGRSGGGRRFLIGVELTFSPPKSYSLAALAGPQVDRVLLGLHRQAVTAVLDQLPALLVTRQMGRRYSLAVEMLRFAHPFSRANDPQLHEHVVLIWDLREEKAAALHTFPLFFHQYTLRCFYHYALVAALQDAEYVVSPAAEGSWELAGMDAAAVRTFSKRARAIETAVEGSDDDLFAGVAARLEALRSRRFFPKTDPSVTLAQARVEWKEELKEVSLIPERCARREQFWLKMPELFSLFRASAVSTRWLLLGRSLAACLGQGVPFAEAKDQFFRRVDAAVAGGEILETAGGRLCHPRFFRIEQEVMERVREGLGDGIPLEIGEDSAVPRAVAYAAARPDQIRVVAGVPEKPGVEDVACLNRLHLPEWDAGQVLAFFREYPNQELLVTVAKRPRAGDFLGYLARFATSPPEEWLAQTPILQIRKKPVRLLEGKIPEEVEDVWEWVRGAGEGRSVAVVVPPDYPERMRVAVNREIATRQILPRSFDPANWPVELERVISWEDVQETFDWKNKILFAWRNNPLLRHGSRRSVLEIGKGGFLKTQGVRRSDWRAVGELREVADAVAIVEPYHFRLVAGLQLEALLRYRIKGMRLEAGELVQVRELRGDGSLVLMDGRVVPPVYRAFAPATLVRELHPRGPVPDVVVVEAEPAEGVWARLQKIRFSEGLLVLSRNLAELRQGIAREIHGRWVKQRQAWIKRFWEGEKDYGIFPARKSWGIDESKPLILSPSAPAPDVSVVDPAVEPEEAGPLAEVDASPVVSTMDAEPPPAEGAEEPVGEPASAEEPALAEPSGEDEGTRQTIIPPERVSEVVAAPTAVAVQEQMTKPSAEVDAPAAAEPAGEPMKQEKPPSAEPPAEDDGMAEITIPLVTTAPPLEESVIPESVGKKMIPENPPAIEPPASPPRARPSSVEGEEEDETARKRREKKALEEAAVPPKIPEVQTKPTKRVKPPGKGPGKGKSTKTKDDASQDQQM